MLMIGACFSSCNDREKATAKPPEIPVVEIRRHNVPVYQEFVGQVYGEQDIAIRARVEGFLEGIHFNEGTRVTKGQLRHHSMPRWRHR